MDPTYNSAGAGMAGAVMGIVWLAVMVLMIVSGWKLFVKAGKPGWASIVPIYNAVVLLEVTGKPIWWIILFFIPLVNIVIAFLVMKSLAECFGKGVGYALGLMFLGFIFFPMLAFSDAAYQAPAAPPSAA